MKTLTIEQKEKAQEVFKVIKELEVQYGSDQNRKIEDIEACYCDDYILEIWKSEGLYNEETCEGWNSFEDFLISFIEQNIQIIG